MFDQQCPFSVIEKNNSGHSIFKNTLHFVEDALDAGVAEKNLTTGEQRWSLRFFDLLGYAKNEISKTSDYFINSFFILMMQKCL